MNDLFDLESDRRHQTKHRRPLASGALSIRGGLLEIGLLLPTSFLLAALTGSTAFVGCMGIYLLATTLYSYQLKHMLFLDVLVLAGLYTHRVIAGGTVISVVISPWLMAFCIFLFISLAFAKRYCELSNAQLDERECLHNRGYRKVDLDLIASNGISSGYMSVLVCCLYVSSDDMAQMYRCPQLLWLVAPLLVYWIARVWFLARRNELHEDPIVFALRDRVSHWTALATVAVVSAAALW